MWKSGIRNDGIVALVASPPIPASTACFILAHQAYRQACKSFLQNISSGKQLSLCHRTWHKSSAHAASGSTPPISEKLDYIRCAIGQTAPMKGVFHIGGYIDANLARQVTDAAKRGEAVTIADKRPISPTRSNTLSARTVHDIVTGRNGAPHFRGVQLSGFYIVGDLDLSFLSGTGQLALVNCYIYGDVDLQQARFTGEVNLDGSRVNHLDLRGASIDGNLLLRKFRADAGIRGIGLNVTGALRLSDSHVCADPAATKRMAVEIFRAKLGDVFLEGSKFRGGIYAAGITVERNLRLFDTIITSRVREGWVHDGSDHKGAVVLTNAEVKGSLYFWTEENPRFSANDTVTLRMAKCRQLFINKETLGRQLIVNEEPLIGHQFVLDGLTYEGLNKIECDELLDVLNTQNEPEISRAYVQLASYCAAVGDIRTRRKTLIGLENRLTRALPRFSSLTRWGRRLYRWSVVYGYHPALAILWLLALLVAATLWVHFGVPVFAAKPAAGQLVSDPITLGWSDSIGLVVDGFLPFTSLGIKDRWVAAPTDALEWIWLAAFLLLRFISWGLAALALLSFTNVARSSRG